MKFTKERKNNGSGYANKVIARSKKGNNKGWPHPIAFPLAKKQ